MTDNQKENLIRNEMQYGHQSKNNGNYLDALRHYEIARRANESLGTFKRVTRWAKGHARPDDSINKSLQALKIVEDKKLIKPYQIKKEVPEKIEKPESDPDLLPSNIHNREAARAHNLRYDKKHKCYRDEDGCPTRDRYGQPLG